LDAVPVDASLDASRLRERIANQRDWLALGKWIEATADEVLPLDAIWNLTHLVPYGWADDLGASTEELVAVLARGDLPKAVHRVLWALTGILRKRSGEDERIEVIRVMK
jgi:hypothetical protein